MLVSVKGSGSKPSGPVRTASVYEVILAIVRVRANASEITAEDIEDTRLNQTYCGLVIDGTEKIPTDGYDAQFTAFMNRVKDNYEEVTKGVIPMENADIDSATA